MYLRWWDYATFLYFPVVMNMYYFYKEINLFKKHKGGFLGGAVVENLPANARDTGSSPSLGRSHMPWSN